MARRLLLPVTALVLLAAALWILSQGPGTGADGKSSPGSTTGEGTETAAPSPSIPEADERSAPGRSGLRSPDAEGSAAGSAVNVDPALGIPSFVGEVVLPDGRPAAAAQVEAWGLSGWAMFVLPDDPDFAPQVSWRTETDDRGRFALPEAPRDGLRFLLRLGTPGMAPLELRNLPTIPGRTRDLGLLHLRLGCEVRGVVSGPNGAPVSGAKVVPIPEPDRAEISKRRIRNFAPLPGYETRSDAEGAFVLRHLPPGKLRLRAEAEGFAPGYSDPVYGREGQARSGVGILLPQSHAIRGVVLDPSQAGVVGAKLRARDDDGQRYETTSGADGSFRIDLPEDVAASPLWIQVVARGFRPWQKHERNPGAAPKLEIHLEPLPPIRGFLVSADGGSVAGIPVGLFAFRDARADWTDPSRLPSLLEVVSAADGSFSLEPDLSQTWERRFRVAAWDGSHSPVWSPILDLSRPTKDQQGLRLVVARGFTVSGAVLLPDGRPAAAAQLHLRRILGSTMPGRRGPRIPDSQRRSTIWRRTHCDAEGKFRFDGVPRGDWRVEAALGGYSPASSEDFALLDAPVDLQLALPRAAGIEGRVVGDLESFPGLRVTASMPGRDPLDSDVDGKGAFRFEGIPLGEYRLVLHEVDSGIASVLFTMGTGEGLARAEGVVVGAGETVPVELRIDRSGRGSVFGTVRMNGEPGVGLNVFLIPRDLGNAGDPRLGWRSLLRRVRSTTTDFQGEYRIAAADADSWWIVIDDPARGAAAFLRMTEPGAPANQGPTGLARARVNLPPGGEQRRDFDLLLGTVRGRVSSTIRGKERVWRWASGTLTPVGSREDGRGAILFRTDRDGAFEVERVPTGSWLLDLRSAYGKIQGKRVEVVSGASTDLDLLGPDRKSSKTGKKRPQADDR